MALDFKVKDVIHQIVAKFIPAFLPEAKKPYNLRATHQPVLDIHGVASKADVYNITTPPKIIEEGMIAGFELMYYLVADGYRIDTPLCSVKMRIPGEYDGSETHLPNGVFPVARLQTSAAFREYLKSKVKIEFSGIEHDDGLFAEAFDEATGLVDEVATLGNLLTVHGNGLKISCDETHEDKVGLYFESECGCMSVKTQIIAVNEPRTLKVIVPHGLKPGEVYKLKIVTQSSAKTQSHLLKSIRELRSDFTLTAQA